MNIKNDLTNFHFASRRKILNIVKLHILQKMMM